MENSQVVRYIQIVTLVLLVGAVFVLAYFLMASWLGIPVSTHEINTSTLVASLICVTAGAITYYRRPTTYNTLLLGFQVAWVIAVVVLIVTGQLAI